MTNAAALAKLSPEYMKMPERAAKPVCQIVNFVFPALLIVAAKAFYRFARMGDELVLTRPFDMVNHNRIAWNSFRFEL